MSELARPDSAAGPRGQHGGRLPWLLLCALAAAMLSLAAVHLPSPLKKLGLFAAAYGLLSGWIAARLAAAFDLRGATTPAWSAAVFGVILAGQIGMAMESHRVRTAALRGTAVADPSTLAAMRKLDDAANADDPKSKEAADEMRRTLDRLLEERKRGAAENASFSGYLRFRVSALGPDVQRFAAGIWIGEIVLGSCAGTWLFRRLTRLDAPRAADKLEA